MARSKLTLLLAPAFLLGGEWSLPARADDSTSTAPTNAAADIGAASGNGFGVGVGISLSTKDAAGVAHTVGTASSSAGSSAQSVGAADATGVGQGLSTAVQNAASGAATSVSAGAGLSVTYTGPSNIGLATGAGFGLNASSAVNTSGAGAPGTTSTSAFVGTGTVTAGPPIGDADANGSSSGTAATLGGASGTQATASSTNTSTADATAAGGGTALLGFVVDPGAPAGDVIAALTLGGTLNATGTHAALFSQTAAGSVTANLTISGAASGISTTGNDAFGLMAGAISGGTGTGNFLLSGTNSAISTTGNNSLGAFALFGGTGNADINFTLSGGGANITTTGDNSLGAYLAATSSGTNTVDLNLSGSGANISTQGLESYGAFLLGMGTGGAVDLTLGGTNSEISTVGNQSLGAYLYTQGTLANLTLSGSNSSISTTGEDAFGAFVANAGLADGAVTLGLSGADAKITTTGDSAVGLFGYTSGTNATLSFDAGGANAGVTTGGDDAHAVFLTGIGTTTTTIDLNLDGAAASLNTGGADAIGAVVSASGSGTTKANITLGGTGARIATTGANAFGVALMGQGTTSATVGLTLGGQDSAISTGANGAVGAFVTANSTGAATAKVTLSGKNASIGTAGTNAFGIYMGGSGATTELEVQLSGKDANVTTTGAGATGVVFGGEGGSLFLSGYGSNIFTQGDAAQGVSFDGDNGLADLANGTTIMATGAGSVAVFFQPGTTGQTVRNAGTIWSAKSLGISGSNGTDTLINSGRIHGGGGTAFDLMAGADAVTLQGGSRIVGRMDLGTGANTVRLETGRDAAWLWSFDGTLPNADITVTGDAPTVIMRPGLSGSTVTFATIDPTGFASTGPGLADLIGSINTMVDSRLSNLTQGVEPPLAFAPYARIANIETQAREDLASLEQARRVGQPGIWAKGFAGRRIQQDDQPTLGNTATFAGFAMGIDASPQSGQQFGLFGGLSAGRLDVDNSAQDIDSLAGFLGAYGRLEFGENFIDLIGSAGVISYESDRLVVNNLAAGGVETASADYSGWFISPELVVGRKVALASGTTMTPKARLRYSAFWVDGYSETGSSANLIIQDRTLQALEGRLELGFSNVETSDAGNPVLVNWYFGALERSRLGDDGVEATLLGQNLAFAVPGDENVFGGYVGGGIDYWTSGYTHLFAMAEFEMVSDKSVSAMIEAGARITF